MGILFGQKNEKKIARRDTVIFDYLRKLDSAVGNYCALFLSVHKLQNQNLRSTDKQALSDTFLGLSEAAKAELFILPNEDMVVIFNRMCRDEVLACLVKIRFILHDDPLLKDAEDLEEIGFAKIYNLDTQYEKFRADVKDVVKSSVVLNNNYTKDENVVTAQSYNLGKKSKKE